MMAKSVRHEGLIPFREYLNQQHLDRHESTNVFNSAETPTAYLRNFG